MVSSLFMCLTCSQAGLRLHGRPMQAVQSSLCACDMTQLSVTQLTHTVWALAKMRAALQAKVGYAHMYHRYAARVIRKAGGQSCRTWHCRNPTL